MDIEGELRDLAGQADVLVARIEDMADARISGETPQAQENRTIRTARARLAREQAVRLRAELRRVAERTRELTTGADVEAAGPTPVSVLRSAAERDLIGQAKGVLRHRHRLSADFAYDCLLSIARATGLDALGAASLVLESVDDPTAAPPVDPLDVVLRRVPRGGVLTDPLALHLTRTGGRPMVQLRYRHGAADAGGAAEFVAVQPPTGRTASYEVVGPRALLLEAAEVDAALGAGRGLRWVRPGDRRAPLLWGDAEALVAAVVNRHGAARVATHLDCPLVEHGDLAN